VGPKRFLAQPDRLRGQGRPARPGSRTGKGQMDIGFSGMVRKSALDEKRDAYAAVRWFSSGKSDSAPQHSGGHAPGC